jgi:hypothetical protein
MNRIINEVNPRDERPEEFELIKWTYRFFENRGTARVQSTQAMQELISKYYFTN